MERKTKKSIGGVFLKLEYAVIYQITKFFPHGARYIDAIIFHALGSKPMQAFLLAVSSHPLKKIKSFDSICVLADVNIGDAVFDQSLVFALRDFFPHARIDYIIKKSARNIIEGNREISNVYGIYTEAPIPGSADIQAVNAILAETSYNVIINFCPFISKKSLRVSSSSAYISFIGMVPLLMNALKNNKNFAHLRRIEYEFTRLLFSRVQKPVRKENLCDMPIFISPHAVASAKEFLFKNRINPSKPKIFFGVDTSSRFTRIPLLMQIELCKKLIQHEYFLLIAVGHSPKHLIDTLINALSPEKLSLVKIVPNTVSLEIYAAIIDQCDVYITGDTGPMHIAAARKLISKEKPLRNKTAVLSVFGATPPRVYGYDSQKPGLCGACQDAVSKVYAGKNQYRNITYMNKHDIVCDENLFFDIKDVDRIVSDLQIILSKLPSDRNNA